MTRKDITDMIKRFLITFCCCLPVFFGIGFLLDGKINDFVTIAIFVTIGGLVFALEEYFHFNAIKKRKDKKQKKGDN